MQQKNQAPMSEEEQEGEVINRRNSEEISLFPHPVFPLLRPIQPCDVISCQVILCCVSWRITKEEGAWQNVRLLSLVTWAQSPIAHSNRKWAHNMPPLHWHHHRTGSDVTPVLSAISESLTVNRDDKTHQISASAEIGWFLQYRRSFLVLSLGKEKG